MKPSAPPQQPRPMTKGPLIALIGIGCATFIGIRLYQHELRRDVVPDRARPSQPMAAAPQLAAPATVAHSSSSASDQPPVSSRPDSSIPPSAPQESGPVLGTLAGVEGEVLTIVVEPLKPFGTANQNGTTLVPPGRWAVQLGASATIERVVFSQPTPSPTPHGSSRPPTPIQRTPVSIDTLRVGDMIGVYFSRVDEASSLLVSEHVELLGQRGG